MSTSHGFTGRTELKPIIDQIVDAESPVGMDAVYVHALILDKLAAIEEQLAQLAASDSPHSGSSS